MPTTGSEIEEESRQIPEELVTEGNQGPANSEDDDSRRDSSVSEPYPGPDGVEEVTSIDHRPVAEAPAVRTYPSEEALDRRDETGVLFVDVREAHEVAEGVIPGAMHVPLERVETAIDPDSPSYNAAFDDAAEIVFYCASGRRSAVAAQRSTETGFFQVAHVEGGIRAWADAGGPVQAVRAPDRLR
ncbi:hypothetical protein G9C85_11980 [Halorubellus sp. JP-L1]|uniref:rhodanese-like domain-containing protein n=1 Tax=Halorubellus sp. JP-L1 TaxID=2715753 RepID=UPI00140C6E12|nr:rhodanese-like domain-containing protein [Halorubellus sp. JP-L1]NHN42340.1 hypothetical protein [Halorubellus sp. JP-L1]